MSFISNWGAGLSDRVDELYSQHPFVNCEFDFSGEVVDVLDERAKDFSASWVSRGTDGVNAMLGEVGIESLRH
jgi:hypothetical protein